MTDDNVTKFPKPRAVPTGPGEPNPKVIAMIEIALERAKEGRIDFCAMVCMPSDGGAPIISAAGVADPYRVIGALMHGTFQHLGVADVDATRS